MRAIETVRRTAEHVRRTFEKEGTGHDWHHIERVWRTSKSLAAREKADKFVVELAALLHDIADWKFHAEDAGPKVARAWLEGLGVEESVIERVCHIVGNSSYKGAKVKPAPLSLEGRIVQDADRLDAIGAIGIARCFAYGGSKHRLIHDPKAKPVPHKTAKAYHNAEGTSVNHFYEKLLLLKDRMNTKAGLAMAAERHRFMQRYLKQLFREWQGRA
jgi:uncharacterized protein